MKTNRRTLLGAGAALALPTWIARAFDEDAAPRDVAEPAPKATRLAEAEQGARSLGKPLLVIFTDPECAPGDAGRIWGEFFMHATEDALLDLALVEVVCLPRAAVGAQSSPASDSPRWAMLIETDAKGGGPRFVDARLPTVAEPEVDTASERSRCVRERAAALAVILRAAILPDGEELKRRAAQSVKSAPDLLMNEEQGRLEAALMAESTARLVDLDRFAACVRLTGSERGHERLALAARVRLFEHDPAGARWGTASNNCPPCGMGYTPPESRYFLRFYAE